MENDLTFGHDLPGGMISRCKLLLAVRSSMI
jgi:hypothetical protein